MKSLKIKNIVKDAYGKVAKGQGGCGCGVCEPDVKEFAKGIGYSEDELKDIPEASNLALSCGNPTAFAGLKKGETVLDLGSGAGFDCFIAAKLVGPNGKVIGIDMTPEMIEKARKNAKKGNYKNVEFRLGEIESLPVEDNSARKIQKSIDAYVGCVGGAILVDEYRKVVEDAGLKNVKVTIKGPSACIDPDTKDPIGRALLDGLGKSESLGDYVVSVYVEGRK